MDASQHVARLFLRDLGRQADPAGQAFWESRAKEVSPAQLNVEFREAAKQENPQAGQARGSGMATDPYSTIALPGEEGYRPDKSTNFFQQLAPFIVPIIGAVAPALLPAIGSALLPAGASAAAAAAVGAGVVNAGVTAATGGSASDIVKAGLAAGAGTYAGSAAGQAVKSAQQAGTLSGTVGGSATLPAVAAGAAGAGTGTLIQTGDLGQAGLAAIGGGIGQGIGGAALDVLPDDANLTLKSGLASAAGGAGEAAVTGQDIGASALVSGLAGAGQDYITEQRLRAAETAATPSANQFANIEDIIKQAYVDPSSKVEVAQAMGAPAGGAALANAVEASIVRNMVTQLPQSILDKIVANSTPLQQVLAETERQRLIQSGASTLDKIVSATERQGAGSLLDRIISTAEGRSQLLKDIIANTPEFAKKYGNEATIQSLSDAGASTAARTIGGAAALLTPGNIFQETNEEAELAARRLADPNFNPVEVLPTVEVIAPPGEFGVDLTRTVLVPKTGGGIDPFGNISPQRDSVQSLYDRYLNREADQAGREFWQQRATEVSPDQLQREFEEAARRELTAPSTQAGTQTQTNTQTQTATQTQPSTQTQTGTPRGSSGGGGGGGGTAGGTTPTITDTDREIINLTGIDSEGPTVTGPPAPTDTIGGDETGGDETGGDETTNVDTGVESTTRTVRRKKKRRGTVETKTVPLATLLGMPLTMMPGSSALAQALSVGDAGGSYMDKKGQRRQPVWNVESLKLSDELGGSGYD
jgi:hypothetical protein